MSALLCGDLNIFTLAGMFSRQFRTYGPVLAEEPDNDGRGGSLGTKENPRTWLSSAPLNWKLGQEGSSCLVRTLQKSGERYRVGGQVRANWKPASRPQFYFLSACNHSALPGVYRRNIHQAVCSESVA